MAINGLGLLSVITPRPKQLKHTGQLGNYAHDRQKCYTPMMSRRTLRVTGQTFKKIRQATELPPGTTNEDLTCRCHCHVPPSVVAVGLEPTVAVTTRRRRCSKQLSDGSIYGAVWVVHLRLTPAASYSPGVCCAAPQTVPPVLACIVQPSFRGSALCRVDLSCRSDRPSFSPP